MSQQIQPCISPREYLRLERQSEYKSECIAHLPSIDCSLVLNEVYDRINFDPNQRVRR